MERIAIIGSGFCGTALAIQLLQKASKPLQIALINKSGRFAKGLAYGTSSPSHILNVPAERMSLFSDRPSDFLDFARDRAAEARAGDFLSRHLYGDYLQARFQEALENSHPKVTFESLSRHVTDLQMVDGRMSLALDNGESLEATRTIIATGNFSPATPASLRELQADPRYIRDPWKHGALDEIPAHARVLLLGTGLTMYDIALALEDNGHSGPVLAISRRALLPQAHRNNTRHPDLPALPECFRQPMGLCTLIATLRNFIQQVEKAGYDWRDAVAAIRPITPMLWQGLDNKDRSRFLRHLQPYWDTHRHRAAPPVAKRVEDLRSAGRLQIQAARVVAARGDGNGIRLELNPRGEGQSKECVVDYLVNCTGPCTDLRSANEPLLARLLARGEIEQDEHKLGLKVDGGFRVIDRHGNANPGLFLLSPMLRASYWESTAVPELRQHAERLGELLLADH
ncbi:FAD/NAD(P)-binding protein [Pseudomonas citronellolis]|uniref:FAD/NAD(P)-binding protein n=1 Tax=Pseudomonas citronellolis TaxID=53408 RepID=UPI0023E39987|nr:FAD/NAD(P)-binding protein [Pseudomonas citronellolis]MDF3935307.1 FAD/NAD(P)-binding protein [Pseudomonas citronellolis]